MTATKNRYLSRTSQFPSSQASFEGNDLVLNYDVKSPDFALASSAGITVDRSASGFSPARFYWDENELSWKTMEDLDIIRLNIKATDQIGLTFSMTDPIVIGPETGQNLAFDNNTIQSRNNNGSSKIEINPLGGNVTVGSLDFTGDLSLLGRVSKISGKDSISINTPGQSGTEVIDVSTGGTLQTESSIFNIKSESLSIDARTTINGLPVINIYRQETFPSVGSDSNLTNNDVLYKTDEAKVYVYNEGTTSWVDVLDPGEY